MSRTSRQFRRWEEQTRKHASEDARQFALDLYWGQPRPVDPYRFGIALEAGEQLYRCVWARYSTLARTPDLLDPRGRLRHGAPYWQDWGWCQTLVTSHRLASRLAGDGDRLISNWWTAIAGVQVDPDQEVATLDDHAGDWRGLYTGPAVPVISVAAIERVHGSAALANHPALACLHKTDPTSGCCPSTRQPSSRAAG